MGPYHETWCFPAFAFSEKSCLMGIQDYSTGQFWTPQKNDGTWYPPDLVIKYSYGNCPFIDKLWWVIVICLFTYQKRWCSIATLNHQGVFPPTEWNWSYLALSGKSKEELDSNLFLFVAGYIVNKNFGTPAVTGHALHCQVPSPSLTKSPSCKYLSSDTRVNYWSHVPALAASCLKLAAVLFAGTTSYISRSHANSLHLAAMWGWFLKQSTPSDRSEGHGTYLWWNIRALPNRRNVNLRKIQVVR